VAIKLDVGEYAKAEESALSLDLKMERIKAIQQDCPHKHTNSSHQPPLLNQGLSTSLAKGLDI
jgi:hypothetical protein